MNVKKQQVRFVNGIEERECIECEKWLTVDLLWVRQGVTKKHCKTCQSRRSRRSANKRRGSVHQRDRKLKATSGCVDCGETDPDILQWDHVCGKKKMAISAMIARSFGPEVIDEERTKCEVRCANCHTKRTRKQFKYLEGYSVHVRHLSEANRS